MRQLYVPSFFALTLLGVAACNGDSSDISLGNKVTLPGDDDGDDDVTSSGGRSSSSGRNGSSSGGGTSSSGNGGSSGAGGSSSGSLPGEDLSEEFEGKATFYDVGTQGNCSLPLPSDNLVVALNTEDYEGSALCGGCLEVTGPSGSSVTVLVWDRCPGCADRAPHTIDLRRAAFAEIADTSLGVIDVTWKVVRCPEGGPMRYEIATDRVQVRNHSEPILGVQVVQDGDVQTLDRENHNVFTGASIADREFRLRITGITGTVVEETLPGRGNGQIGTQQF